MCGPTIIDTNHSLDVNAYNIRSAFNMQSVAVNNALNYDCNIFNQTNFCISAGGRFTSIDNPTTNNFSSVIALGYKLNPNIRIGGYLDQNINTSNPSGIHIGNKIPLMGAYAVWNKQEDGLGYQLRLANTFQNQDITSTRRVFDTGGGLFDAPSEAGSGTSSLNSQSYLAEMSYAFQYQDKTLVRPYFGLRYTRLKQDGYTEALTASVTNPLTFNALSDKSASALLGVKLNYSLTEKATLTGQIGLEQDFYHSVSNYSATSLNTPFLYRSVAFTAAFNDDIKRTRPVASAGVYYDLTKAQRISAAVNYTQLPFQSTSSVTGYFNYTIGF
jgi:hypothetical protein